MTSLAPTSPAAMASRSEVQLLHFYSVLTLAIPISHRVESKVMDGRCSHGKGYQAVTGDAYRLQYGKSLTKVNYPDSSRDVKAG